MTAGESGAANTALSAGQLIVWLALSAIVGLFLLFAAVLPAEFGRDPSGLGKMTGLDRLWQAEEIAVTAGSDSAPAVRTQAMPFRRDRVTIRMNPAGAAEMGDEIEYKLRMHPGDAVVYSWKATGGEQDMFYADFHSHTEQDGNEDVMVASHLADMQKAANGALIAPFEGLHGWYFQNQSEDGVTVTIDLAGFYEIVPLTEKDASFVIEQQIGAEAG